MSYLLSFKKNFLPLFPPPIENEKVWVKLDIVKKLIVKCVEIIYFLFVSSEGTYLNYFFFQVFVPCISLPIIELSAIKNNLKE